MEERRRREIEREEERLRYEADWRMKNDKEAMELREQSRL